MLNLARRLGNFARGAMGDQPPRPIARKSVCGGWGALRTVGESLVHDTSILTLLFLSREVVAVSTNFCDFIGSVLLSLSLSHQPRICCRQIARSLTVFCFSPAFLVGTQCYFHPLNCTSILASYTPASPPTPFSPSSFPPSSVYYPTLSRSVSCSFSFIDPSV